MARTVADYIAGWWATTPAGKKAASTALIKASRNGDIRAVQALLGKGADLNARGQYGSTALMNATEGRHSDVVTALLDMGADVNAVDHDFGTALVIASSNGDYSLAKTLLDNGAKVNHTTVGTTALMRACLHNRRDVVQLLLSRGADVNAKNTYGDTALSWACEKGHSEVMRALLDAGAEFDDKARSFLTPGRPSSVTTSPTPAPASAPSAPPRAATPSSTLPASAHVVAAPSQAIRPPVSQAARPMATELRVPADLRAKIIDAATDGAGDRNYRKGLVEICKTFEDGLSTLSEARRICNSRLYLASVYLFAQELDEAIKAWQLPTSSDKKSTTFVPSRPIRPPAPPAAHRMATSPAATSSSTLHASARVVAAGNKKPLQEPMHTSEDVSIANVARTHSDRNERKAAVELLSDQAVLSEVATNDRDSRVRMTALAKLKDKAVISDIAERDPDLGVRMAAERLLGRKSTAFAPSQPITPSVKATAPTGPTAAPPRAPAPAPVPSALGRQWSESSGSAQGMQKFGYIFDAPATLAYNDTNVARVEGVVRASGWLQFFCERHSSGCIQLYVFLPSSGLEMNAFFELERAFRAAGLRGAEGIRWAEKNPPKR